MALQFIADLHRISGRLAAAVEGDPAGRLPIADLIALTALYDREQFTVAQLQKQIGFAPSTVSSILNRLERRELIERQSSTRDRRTFHIVLTAGGRAAAVTAQAFLESLEDKMTAQLSYAHVIAFSEVIEALDRALRADPPARLASSIGS